MPPIHNDLTININQKYEEKMELLEKRAIGFILLGGITILAFFWQFKLCKKDMTEIKRDGHKYPSRLTFGLILCGCLILGIITHGLIAIYIDERHSYTYTQMWDQVRPTLWFSLIFIIKSYFGPIITMGSLAIAAYFYINYGMLTNLPIVTDLMNFAGSLAPDWLEKVYALVNSGFAIIMSLKDTFS